MLQTETEAIKQLTEKQPVTDYGVQRKSYLIVWEINLTKCTLIIMIQNNFVRYTQEHNKVYTHFYRLP